MHELSTTIPATSTRARRIESAHDHHHLFVAQHDRAIARLGPTKRPFLEPLGRDPNAGRIELKDLESVVPGIAEDKQLSGARIDLESTRDDGREAVERLSHVRGTGNQVDRRLDGEREHARNPGPKRDSSRAWCRCRWAAAARAHCRARSRSGQRRRRSRSVA